MTTWGGIERIGQNKRCNIFFSFAYMGYLSQVGAPLANLKDAFDHLCHQTYMYEVVRMEIEVGE